MRHRYFISLGFDGTAYRGWQVQPGEQTIQGNLERALGQLLGEPIPVVGAGRTDTGVHARFFMAHFDTTREPEAIRTLQLVHKLNKVLPPDIAIQDIYPVDDSAHARFGAISRTYVYQICRRKDPFMLNKSWLFERTLNVGAMQQAAHLLLSYRDFSSFSKSNTQVGTYNCTISHAQWTREEHLLLFEIRADRFLRNMVRAIVGTLVEVGLGKIGTEDFAGIIKARDRSEAGYSAPGCGLFLTGIEYPEATLGKPPN
jgi:tRNA pseudouridine38-40 synthase